METKTTETWPELQAHRVLGSAAWRVLACTPAKTGEGRVTANTLYSRDKRANEDTGRTTDINMQVDVTSRIYTDTTGMLEKTFIYFLGSVVLTHFPSFSSLTFGRAHPLHTDGAVQ